MATFYTQGIESGEIDTFEKFALLCAGATAMVAPEDRDLPLSDEFSADPHYLSSLEDARRDLREHLDLPVDQRAIAAEAEDAREHASRQEEWATNHVSRQRLVAIGSQVKKWNAPSDFVGFKTFMMSQIEIALDNLVDHGMGDKTTADEWYETRRLYLSRAVDDRQRDYDREVASASLRSAQLRSLRKSIALHAADDA